MNSIDSRRTGNEEHEDHIMQNENRKLKRRKSCSKSEPSLLYNFRGNKNVRGEGSGGIATASHYIFIDDCPKRVTTPTKVN